VKLAPGVIILMPGGHDFGSGASVDQIAARPETPGSSKPRATVGYGSWKTVSASAHRNEAYRIQRFIPNLRAI
jgi:hypothetical protein